MFQAIIRTALQHRGLVTVIAAAFLVYGIYVATNAKLDVFPDFVQPQATIQTECPGMAPEQVEVLVTRPIETAVSGLGHMASLRSESAWGLSIITAVFEEGSDIFVARQMLAEKLGDVTSTLPNGVMTPKLTPITSSTMDLLKIGLTSKRLSQMQLRTFADWTLRPRLLAVPGVAKCSVLGGEVQQFQIQLLPDRIVAHDLSISDVVTAARAATGVRGAGFVETDNQRIELVTEGQALTPEQLGQVVVAHKDGASVKLTDVAHVVEAAAPKFGDTLIQGRPGVLMTMSSQYGANTLDVTRRLEVAIAEMKPVFEREGITLYPRLHRPATFIETAVNNIGHSLSLGGILVVLVLFLILGSARSACISLTAIPMSLLAAVVVLEHIGVSVNTITLGGLAIALGEVVDDSIIDVENIFRRLRENQALPQPRSVFAVVLDASLEVRSAVVYATLIVIVVFTPVLALTGLQGRFFSPLALSYILAISASLIVALVLTPALALLLYGRGLKTATEPRLQRYMKSLYRWFLARVIHRPRTTFLFVAVVCIITFTRLSSFGGELLPDFREGHFVLQVSALPGTALPEMVRIGKRISLALLKIKGIRSVEQQVGRAELGEDPWGPERSEFHVDLDPMPGDDETKVEERIRHVLSSMPGIQSEVLTFLGDRIGETLTGETAAVVVNIFGDDLDALDATARDVAQVLTSVSGASDVQIKSPPGSPRLAIRLRADALARFGLRPIEVLDAVRIAFQGDSVAEIYFGDHSLDVVALLTPEDRSDPELVGRLPLTNIDGQRLWLSDIADIDLIEGRYVIRHEGARRRQTVTCNPMNRDVASFVNEAKALVRARVHLPAGVYLEFSGAAEARAQAERQLLINSAIAALGILILLSLAFRHWRNMLLVLANVPFALVGGVLAVAMTTAFGASTGLSMGGLVGFVTLFGMTMRNSIMMVSHFEHLVTREKLPWGRETAIQGASERLMPIVMTALVTGLGLLPLALGMGDAGREIEGPMAVVILGGLFTSTLLNLLVLPTLALGFGRFGE